MREVFENLGILERVCDNDGKLRRHFNVHVNEEEDVRLLQGLDTIVKEGDVVTILSAIAGGDDIKTETESPWSLASLTSWSEDE